MGGLEGKQPLTAFATVRDRSKGNEGDKRGGGGSEGEASTTTLSSAAPAPPTSTASPSTTPSSEDSTFAVPPLPGRQPQPRKKIPFEKGFSQQDWLRLTRDPREDLRGLGKGGHANGKVTMAEVRSHNTQDDAWLVLDRKVYNVTRYMRFHPGGVDYLMKGVGRDATALFYKYHKWVNAHFMLEKCFVGFLEQSSSE